MTVFKSKSPGGMGREDAVAMFEFYLYLLEILQQNSETKLGLCSIHIHVSSKIIDTIWLFKFRAIGGGGREEGLSK